MVSSQELHENNLQTLLFWRSWTTLSVLSGKASQKSRAIWIFAFSIFFFIWCRSSYQLWYCPLQTLRASSSCWSRSWPLFSSLLFQDGLHFEGNNFFNDYSCYLFHRFWRIDRSTDLNQSTFVIALGHPKYRPPRAYDPELSFVSFGGRLRS